MNTGSKFKIGIIGVGMVGTPLKRYFEEFSSYKRGEDLFLYDKNPVKGYDDNINEADIIFICVPTPRAEQGHCDLSAVESAFNLVNSDGKIVVIKSTVPPGTTESFQRRLTKLKVLFNPEFLTESRAWEDTIRPDRQIIGFTAGGLDAAQAVLSILPKAPFMSPWGINTYNPVKITATEAELIKYAGNIHFVRKVNWANALAKTCEKLRIDYENVRRGLAADFRIGDSHLDVNHGGYRGWGGYCFPKDLDAFISFASSNNLSEVHELLSSDRKFNEKLLAEQGLTLKDVAVHNNELDLKKRS